MILKLTSITPLSAAYNTGAFTNRISANGFKVDFPTFTQARGRLFLSFGLHVAILDGTTGELRPGGSKVFFSDNQISDSLSILDINFEGYTKSAGARAQFQSLFGSACSLEFCNFFEQHLTNPNDIVVMVVLGTAINIPEGPRVFEKLKLLGVSQNTINLLTDFSTGWQRPWVFASQNGRSLIDKVGEPFSQISISEDVELDADIKAKKAAAELAANLARQKEMELARQQAEKSLEEARIAEIARLDAEKRRLEEQKAKEIASAQLKQREEETKRQAIEKKSAELREQLAAHEVELTQATQSLEQLLDVFTIFKTPKAAENQETFATLQAQIKQ